MLFTQAAKLEPRFCSGDYRPFLAAPIFHVVLSERELNEENIEVHMAEFYSDLKQERKWGKNSHETSNTHLGYMSIKEKSRPTIHQESRSLCPPPSAPPYLLFQLAILRISKLPECSIMDGRHMLVCSYSPSTAISPQRIHDWQSCV
jgi:hypothetical protein